MIEAIRGIQPSYNLKISLKVRRTFHLSEITNPLSLILCSIKAFFPTYKPLTLENKKFLAYFPLLDPFYEVSPMVMEFKRSLLL